MDNDHMTTFQIIMVVISIMVPLGAIAGLYLKLVIKITQLELQYNHLIEKINNIETLLKKKCDE